LTALVAGASAAALTVSAFALGASPTSASVARQTVTHAPTGRDCLAAIRPGVASHARQRAFTAASHTYGVPYAVLLGVSYLESRWDDHGRSPSTSGGYGPMHLTNVDVEPGGNARGAGSFDASTGPQSLHTAKVAARLTGLSTRRLISDDAANICGGAALLASTQRHLGRPLGATTKARSWYDAVAVYSGSADGTEASVFAARVFHHPHRRHPVHQRRTARQDCGPPRPSSPVGQSSDDEWGYQSHRLPLDAGLRMGSGAVRAVRPDGP